MAIRRLRRRFIMIATLAIVAVMIIVISLINSLNYRTTDLQIDAVLAYITSNDGDLPVMTEGGGKEAPADTQGLRAFSQVVSDLFSSSYNLQISKEDQFQIRYFTVRMDKDGDVSGINLNKIALIEDDDAGRFAETVYKKGDSTGKIEEDGHTYNYQMSIKDGTTLIVFLDSTYYVQSASRLLHVSVIIAGFCFFIFMAIITALSNRAIQPEIRNMEAQKQFITNAGHELKTPLAIISANAELLEMMNGENEWTQSIRNQSKRLSMLVGDLITLARMGEQSNIVLTDTDVSSVIKEAAEEFRPVIEQQHKAYHVNVPDDLHSVTEGRLVRELTNILVDNASKYCDEEGSIHVDLEKRGRNGVKLTVSNTYEAGKDIDYTRFFERFYRADQSHNSEKAGYGIGLSMAQSICEQVKGYITVGHKDGDIIFTVFL